VEDSWVVERLRDLRSILTSGRDKSGEESDGA
jgi:hypothetical protein